MKLFRQILIWLSHPFRAHAIDSDDFYSHRVFETCEDFNLTSTAYILL